MISKPEDEDIQREAQVVFFLFLDLVACHNLLDVVKNLGRKAVDSAVDQVAHEGGRFFSVVSEQMLLLILYEAAIMACIFWFYF